MIERGIDVGSVSLFFVSGRDLFFLFLLLFLVVFFCHILIENTVLLSVAASLTQKSVFQGKIF